MSVFPGTLTDAVERIRSEYPFCRYDHRPYPREAVEVHRDIASERFRLGYACLKYTIAAVLKPQSIVEIGVGFGVAARAFLSASEAIYLGFDNGCLWPHVIDMTRESLLKFPQAAVIQVADSRNLTALPACDLAHVDGCHDYDWAYHDTLIALRAAPWVLVDDTRDSQVAAAAMRAAYDYRAGDFEWAAFEDSLSGNILLYRGP